MYVCMCVAEREREGGMIGERKGEEGLEVGGNTLTPLKIFSSHFFFFPWHVIFRFTILIMMILERRGGGGGRRGEDDGRRMQLFTLSFLFLFFLLLHIAWRERQRDRERLEDGVVGASMTNFPFFYGSINLTGGGLWG